MGKNNIVDSLAFDVLVKDNGFNEKLKKMEEVAKKFNITVSQALEIMGKVPPGEPSGGKPQKAIEGLKRQLADLEKQWGSLNAAQRKGADGQGLLNQYRALKGEAGQYGGTLNTTVKSLDKATASSDKLKASQNDIIRSVRKANNDFTLQGRAVSNLNTLFTSYVSIFAVERLVSNIARVRGEFELQQVALRAIIQDAQAADTIFSQIKGLAIESPFQFKELTGYVKQLAAFSIETDKLFDTTSRLADISAGLGVDMGRIILAYGQVRSASVLRGQELRQFTEAGIPLVDQLAKKFGELEGRVVSAGEVFEKISNRQVSFGMVDDIFSDLTSEGGMFFEMQAKQAETLAGKLSNLKDAYEIMLNDIGMANDGILKGGIDGMRSLMENWREVGTALMTVVAVYGAYKVASALNTQMLGKENQELIKRLLANKEMIASELRKKAVYSTLSEEEIALTRNTNTLTNADLRNLAANGLLTKSAALRMITTKQLTAAHGAELVSLNLITQAELTQALATTRFALAKQVLIGVARKVGSAFKALWVTMLSNPLTWVIAAVGAITAIWSNHQQKIEELKQSYDRFNESIKNARDQSMELAKQIKSIKQPSDSDGLKKYNDQLLEIISANKDWELIVKQRLIGLNNEKDIAEVILQTYKEIQSAIPNLNRYAETSGQAKETTNGWADEGIEQNAKDAQASLSDVRREMVLLSKQGLDTTGAEKELVKLTKSGADMNQIYQALAKWSNHWKETTDQNVVGLGALQLRVREFGGNVVTLQEDTRLYFDYLKADIRNANGDKIDWTNITDFKQLDTQTKILILRFKEEYINGLGEVSVDIKNAAAAWFNQEFQIQITPVITDPKKGLSFYEKSITDAWKKATRSIAYDKSLSNVIGKGVKISEIFDFEKAKNFIDALDGADGNLVKLKAQLATDKNSGYKLFDKATRGANEYRLAIGEATLAVLNYQKNDKSSGKDPVAEKLKNQIDLLKKAEEQYKKYLNIMSKEEATERVLKNPQFASLKVAFKDYSPEDTRKYLDQMHGSIKGNKRFADIEKLLGGMMTDWDTSDIKSAVDKMLSAIKSELDKAKSDYDLVQNLLSKGVDKSSVELLLDVKINNQDKGDMIRESISKLLNESVGDIGSLGDIEIEAGVTFKNAFDSGDIKKVTDNLNKVPEAYQSGVSGMLNELQTFDTEQIVAWANIVTKYGEAEAKKNQIHQEALQERTAIEKKYAELIEKAKDDTQKEQLTKERDTYVAAVANKETQSVAKVDFDAFKETDEWKKSFEDLDRISTNSLNTIIGKLENFAQSTGSNLNVTEFKELIGALKKMRNETEKRNPFQTLADAITEYKTAVGEVKAADDEVATSQANLALATQARVNAEAELSSGSGDKVAQEIKHAAAIDSERKALIAATDAVKKKDNAEDKLKNSAAKANKSFKDIASYASAATSGLTEIFTSLGVDMDGVFGAIWGGFSKVVDGLASIDLNNPVSIITGSAKAISGVLDMIFGSKQAVIENQIKDSVKQVKRLENAYSDLERVIDKALGDDKFKAHGKMLNNLGNQMTEISKQADLERSKKHSDGDKVDDLKRQYVELGQQIDDLLTSIKDDIIGSTAKDIAQELGDAIFEAFANGTDAAEAWGAKVDEIIGDILKKMLISKFLEKPIADAVDKFYQMTMPANAKAQELADKLNNLNQEISEVETGGRASSGRTKDQLVKERDQIADLLKKQNATIENEVPKINKEAFDGLQNSLNGVGGNFQAIVDALPEDLKKYLFGDGEAGEGLKEGIKGVTEDTASLIASYLNAIRQHVATQGISLSSGERNLAIIAAAVQNMNWLMGDSRAMATQGILHLKNIEANTFNTAAEAKAIAESAAKTIKVAVEIAESNREIASYWRDVTTGAKQINVK